MRKNFKKNEMAKLPIIVGFGGVNAAGRASEHHAYRRMIIESLTEKEREDTILGLAVMMGLLSLCTDTQTWKAVDDLTFSDAKEAFNYVEKDVLAGTLVREISDKMFDVNSVPVKAKVSLSAKEGSHEFSLSKRRLPSQTPENWHIKELDSKTVHVTVKGDMDVMVDTSRAIDVKSAGQLPEGFDPSSLYNSRFHPKGLSMAVAAVSDAVNSVGIEWETIRSAVSPDEIAVYASSFGAQLDDNGFGGLLQSRLKGDRVSSKQLALGINSMPADFVNAYVCGSVGGTGAITGACATFLYNLKAATDDIREGRKRVVIVGAAEAPITTEIIEGFDAMGAVARASQLEALDGGETDLSGSSRPFGENCGFTVAESAQYIVLMDDDLTLELGAQIHGAIGDVFVNADGFKKSISSPGVGNYITMSKAVASAIAIAGEDAVKNRSFVHSHGSSTPQNRVTESTILNKVACVFGINDWPVTAVKSYIGHSLSPASGDQLSATLGTFKFGYLPGIKTVDKIADDVVQENLNFALGDMDLKDKSEVAFLNSKGFGGNNASAVILSPRLAKDILTKRHSDSDISSYESKLNRTIKKVEEYDAGYIKGDFKIVYNFGKNMVDESQVEINREQITIPGFDKPISLKMKNPYQ